MHHRLSVGSAVAAFLALAGCSTDSRDLNDAGSIDGSNGSIDGSSPSLDGSLDGPIARDAPLALDADALAGDGDGADVDGADSGPSCCASGYLCPGSDEVCDLSCRCVSVTDCRTVGCRAGEICDESSGSCGPDTRCGPACTGDFICASGTCTHRCWYGEFTCPLETHCNETDGCVAPRCTHSDCAVLEPPQRCDPARGCFDPCTEPGSDWSWCTSMGGRCYHGSCVDDGCAGTGGLACNYRYDCCGNALCLRDDQPEPPCVTPCGEPMPPPPRPDLCRCAPRSSSCVDSWRGEGGGGIIPG